MLKRFLKIVTYAIVAVAFSSANAGSYEDFFTAMKRDDASAVAGLLNRGFDPNSLDPSGQPALVLAVKTESWKVAEALLAARGVDLDAANPVGETALMMAALRGRIDWCRRLIERGARINQPGWTALHYAATGPEPAVVQLLLERGATVDAESQNRTTPLMMAARYGDERSVELLLARGADLRRTNDRGLNAAEFARIGERDKLARRLQAAAAR